MKASTMKKPRRWPWKSLARRKRKKGRLDWREVRTRETRLVVGVWPVGSSVLGGSAKT